MPNPDSSQNAGHAETRSPRRSPRRKRLFALALAGAAFLLLLIPLALLVENWSGQRAWNKFRAEWEAKGERFDVAAVLPKPVPDEQNFAMTPFLAPLFDYSGHPPRWSDPEGREQAASFGEVFTKTAAGRKVPRLGGWESGVFTDLAAWQDFFTDNVNDPAAATPGMPAREVLTALRRFDPALEELRAASARPYSVFAIHYDDNIEALLPHLAILKGLMNVVVLQAVAHLADEDANAALQDTKLGLRLAESVKSEPFLISQLVRLAMLQLAMQPVWEALAQHKWSEPQLAEMQTTLARISILEDYGLAMRGERAFGNEMLDRIRTGNMSPAAIGSDGTQNDPSFKAIRFLPDGWFRHNQVFLNRMYQEHSLPLVDAVRHRVYADQARQAENVPELKKGSLHNVFARLLTPALARTPSKFARGQTTIDLATVACALERYRLTSGQYPEKLELLAPRFISKLPNDVISGQTLNYFRTPEGRFVLYSVGWNEADEGGEVRQLKGGRVDPNEGDWVWQHPSR